ncbi:MAG: foldase protein PrsA [Actinomycetota bacterium]|jgi:hypothetical protein|nr:foldase protein PrsA [Actinomycetota bacterium]
MRRLPVLLVALALLAPACSAFGTAPAATVDGEKISTSSVDQEIKTIRANAAYKNVLEQTFGSSLVGTAGKGTFDTAFVAQLISLRIWYAKIEHDLAKRGLHVTPAITAQAAAGMQQQFASLGPKVFSSFPKAYRDTLIHQRALVAVVDQDVTARLGVDDQSFYDKNKDAFAVICLSHALVGVQNRTPAAAQTKARALYDAIKAGKKTFAEVATNESDDAAAAKAGGALGCGSRQSLQLDPTFLTAAFKLKTGVLSAPVPTQFGSHLILVTSRTIPAFADVQADLPQVMQQVHNDRIDAYLTRVICSGSTDVNPRYGTWSTTSCSGVAPQLPSVKPPVGPKGSATTTTSLASGQS